MSGLHRARNVAAHSLWFFLPALVLLFITNPSFAIEGVVWTLDGRRIHGDVRPGPNALTVRGASGADGDVKVFAADIARAQFSTNVIAAQTRGSGNGLLGLYFAGTNFSSNVVMRLDEAVDLDWGGHEPILGMPKDRFGVRWMGQSEAPTTDAYTIYFATEGGGRIYFDNKLAADNFAQRHYSEASFIVNLNAGERHNLMLEYAETGGPARARLSWASPVMLKTVVPSDRLYAASFDTNHTADASALARTQGLLATYYNSADFTSNSFTRIDPEIDFAWKGGSPAPGMPTNNFSVRWLGNLLVTNSGQYQFQVLAGLPLRLYINDKLISNPWMVALIQSSTTTLNKSERNEIRLEIRATNSVVPVKLTWSGPGFSKTLLTREHFSPTIPASREPTPGVGRILPAGVVLMSGAILGAPIRSANSSSIHLQGVLGQRPLALTGVARVHVKPLTAELASALPKGRTGVLLKNRDFIDGEFTGIENGRVQIESVLFGKRSFDLAKDAVAIVLRDYEPIPWRASIIAGDGSVLYGKTFKITDQGIGLAEAPTVPLPLEAVAEIIRRSDNVIDR